MRNLATVLCAAVLTAMLVGCATGNSEERAEKLLADANAQTLSLEESALAELSDAKISGVDIIFSQMMVPHHSQALRLSELAFRFAEDGRVIELALEIYSAQAPEIELMETWLTNANNVPEAQDHSEMRGMLSEKDFKLLESLRGTEFDITWLEFMTEHHLGAVEMVVNQLKYSQTPEVLTLGDDIVLVQEREIAQMRALVEELSG